MKRRVFCLLVSIVLVAGAMTGCKPGRQVSYPSGPVELVVPQKAGSAPDLAARLVADWLSKKWGQPINIVNRSGGGMVVGTQSVMQAKPDGYTMLFDGNGASSFQVLATEQLPYKWDKRTFVARIAEAPMVYVVNASSPLKTLKDVHERIRSDPSTFRCGWQALTTVTGVTIVKWFDAIGVDPSKCKVVEYTSSDEAVAAVAGGHIDFAAAGISTALPMWEMGRVRIVAVTSDRRLQSLPDVPTAEEQGYSIKQSFWQGISGPPGLPKEVVDKWVAAISEMVTDRDFVSALEKQQKMYPAFLGPEAFRNFVLEEARSIQALAKR